jgi:hypothetical protein
MNSFFAFSNEENAISPNRLVFDFGVFHITPIPPDPASPCPNAAKNPGSKSWLTMFKSQNAGSGE